MIRFRVYPGRGTPPRYRHNSAYFFDIVVFPSRGAMYSHKYTLAPHEGKETDFEAIVMEERTHKQKNGRWTITPKLGHALFHKRLGCNIVTHEAVHIALAFLRNQHKRYRPSEKNEEELAYTIGEVTRQLYNGFYRHKLVR